MLRWNIKYSLRNLFRDKFYSIVNGVGLALGIAAVLLIFVWVNDELSFDNFHHKKERIYRVVSSYTFGGQERIRAVSSYPLANAAREQIPEIEQVARVFDAGFTGGLSSVSYLDRRLAIESAYLVDKDFFDIFDFPFKYGDASTAFATASHVAVTADLAEKVFGTTEAIGLILELPTKKEVIVGAVMENVPSNSHLQFELLLPVEAHLRDLIGGAKLHWHYDLFTSYVLLRHGVGQEDVGRKLSDLVPLRDDEEEPSRHFDLQPLSDVYLGSADHAYSLAPRGNRRDIRLVGMIGFLLLLIACINYVNLSTARVTFRSSSAGIRKIVGAGSWQIFGQHVLETAILVLASGLVAIGLAHASFGLFEHLSGKHFTADQLFTPRILLLTLAVILSTVVLSSIRPAWQLSFIRPLNLIDSARQGGWQGKGLTRKLLVVGQFLSSGVLIICTIIMWSQMKYVKEQELGYEREHIFAFNCETVSPILMKQRLERESGILGVTSSDQSIVNFFLREAGFDYEGKNAGTDPVVVRVKVGEEFKGFFGLELVDGRWFHSVGKDSLTFVLNETAVRELGISDPIGKWMEFSERRGVIVGVVRDFHYRSLHHGIEPLIMRRQPESAQVIYVKANGANASKAIASAEKIFYELEPRGIFQHQFLDESYDQLYMQESRSSALFLLFACLMIFVSCLGIFGLAVYSSQRRDKEIGIRKVFGASILGIILLLSKETLALVLMALIIATPLAGLAMQDWLQNFAFHIDIHWWFFVLAGLMLLGIAFLTVGLQSMKAALVNPIHSIRSE